MATWDVDFRVGMLRAMLRATYNASGVLRYIWLMNSTMLTLVKFAHITGTDWNTPANGKVTLAASVATTHNANATIAAATFRDETQASALTPGNTAGAHNLTAGLSNGSRDVVVDDAVITAGEACNITKASIQLPEANGTVKLNTALRNRMLNYLINKSGVHFSAAGTIKVYSGAAPASADDVATGTELISFATTTTTWADVNTSTGCDLTATLTTNASNTGTAGYARYSWNDPNTGETYVIQGSIGTGAQDFVISSTALVSGNSFNLTAANINV